MWETARTMSIKASFPFQLFNFKTLGIHGLLKHSGDIWERMCSCGKSKLW